ncbi:MAG: 3'(2'),5'-bisphosphate nucleotidase CysQ [Alphaproteobacteria bacterium]|nr:3'(2'),5'-bisphosphate nucleotidase CysQ [Alphaproteobacteria bacterium]
MTNLTDMLPKVEDAARRAGDAIMEIYATDFDVEQKDDASPVTAADLAAEAIILEALKDLTPDIPVIAEEEMAAGRQPDITGNRFWLVDPLDGTREFLVRNGEFTVNIGLIEDRRPVLGVVHAPALSLTFAGSSQTPATRQEGDAPPEPTHVRRVPDAGLTISVSRRHGSGHELDRFLEGRRVVDRVIRGSSLKFCIVAAGEADIYPRFGPTKEWDTAAGHAVLAAAGGRVTTTDGAEFLYGKPDFANPPFIAWGGDI